MNRIIIYNSQTGFTKQYAQWLAEEIECELMPWEKVKNMDLAGYDTVIFASWFHAGRIQKLKWFQEKKLGEARKIVLATGATDQNSAIVEEALKNNFPEGMSEDQVFYLRSGLCYERMSLSSRMLMKAFSSMMKKKKDKTAEEKEMADALGESFDASSREYLKPVISYIRENA